MNILPQSTLRIAALAFCLLGSGAVWAQQPGPAVESASAKTSLAGLDLSTSEGMAAARERVHQTARQLCRRLAHSTDLAPHPQFMRCVEATMASALQQLDRPGETAAQRASDLAPPLAPSARPVTRSTRVSFADLNLSTPEGVQAAHERLHQVARALCSQVADELGLSYHANYLACVDKAMSEALPQVQELARSDAPVRGVARNLAH